MVANSLVSMKENTKTLFWKFLFSDLDVFKEKKIYIKKHHNLE